MRHTDKHGNCISDADGYIHTDGYRNANRDGDEYFDTNTNADTGPVR